jgi:hypothetical protein
MVQKLGFPRGSIATNDELMLLTIKGKWLETIVHMIESKFLDLLCPKQVQFLISICIHGNFSLVNHICLCWFSRKHAKHYCINGNQFER